MLRPEVRHILGMEKPTNLKVGTLMENEDPYHRQAPWVAVCACDSTPTVLTVSVDTWHDKSCVLLILVCDVRGSDQSSSRRRPHEAANDTKACSATSQGFAVTGPAL